MTAPIITLFAPTIGDIGSTFIVTGVHFTGTTAVTINGMAATSFTVQSDTSLLVVVGASTTSGLIAITNGTGTTTSAQSFTVAKVPFPVGPFGQTLYGEPWTGVTSSAVIDVSQSALTVAMQVDPSGYGGSTVRWNEPTDMYDFLILVRSTNGYPISQTDGVQIVSLPKAAVVSRIAIDGGLSQGRWVYYALFIRTNPTTWKRVSIERCLIPQDFSSGQTLFNLLPAFYQDLDNLTPLDYNVSTGDPTVDSQGALRRYLSIVGYETDRLRSLAASLGDVTKPDRLLYEGVALAADMYGFPLEPALGGPSLRRLFANWADILHMKGTHLGIEGFATALTGYGEAALSNGLNLVLTTNDSIVVQADPANGGSTSLQWRWGATNSAHLGRNASAPVAIPLSGITTSLAMTMQASGAVVLALGSNSTKYTVRETCIPVDVSTYYWFSFYALAGTTVRTLTPKIEWYDIGGALLSTTTGTGVADSAASWTRISVRGQAPTDAVYARLRIDYSNGVNTEVHYITGAQVEVTVAPTIWYADSFNRANGAAGSTDGAGTYDPHVWAMSSIGGSGAWMISANTLIADATSDFSKHIDAYQPKPGGSDDYRVQCTIDTIGVHTAAVTARVTATGDFYYMMTQGVNPGITLGYYDHVAVDYITLAVSGGYTLYADAGSTMVLEVVGSTLTGWLIKSDGTITQVGPVTDGFIASGSGGPGVWSNGTGWKMDNFQVSPVAGSAVPSSAAPYETARRVVLTLAANRVNLCQNPSFETNKNFWMADAGCAIARSTAFSNGAIGGVASLEVDPDGSTPPIITTMITTMFDEEAFYTASAFVRQPTSSPDASMRAKMRISWFSDLAMTTLISAVDGAQITVPSDRWMSVPISVNAQAPVGTMMGHASIIITSGASASPAAGKKAYVDCVTFEKNGVPSQYFDGATDTNGDYMWGGEVDNSPSYYYPARLLKDNRLKALLPDFVPASVDFTVQYAKG